MIKLRPSTHSACLVLLLAACGESSTNDDTGQPVGTGTTPDATAPGATAPGTNTGAVPGATGTTPMGTTPVGATGGGTTPTPGPGATGAGATGAGAMPSTTVPSTDPTGAPTGPAPTDPVPTDMPTGMPTDMPTGMPTDMPTGMPTTEPPVDPPVVDPQPSLVVSSEGNYWNEGDVTVAESGTANFTVDTSTQFQTWHGWGGTFNEQGWDALQDLDETERQRAIELLFDVNDGLGLDWGRIPIGPSDYAVERYTLSDGPGEFSVEHDRQYLIPYIKAAQAVKNDVRYWASPWTPPPWAKSGTTEAGGYDKGYFNTMYYSEYADFFVSWIQAYEAEGIPIDHVMPQNEPGWAQSYPTCAWGPATESKPNAPSVELDGPVTLGTFVDAHLFPAIDAAGLTTDVWYGTLSNNTYFPSYFNDMMGKASADRIVGVGLQWETEQSIGSIPGNLLIMQSEHRCGNYPWLEARAQTAADATRDNFLPGMAPNNHAYGQESWDYFKSWIDNGVHIYSAWNMVLDTGGFNLDDSRAWPQNALLAVDRAAGTLQVTPYYYAFRHLTQFVDLEAKRVSINGDALAFQNPDGSVVAVMRTTSPGTQIVSIDGTLLQFESGGDGWVTVNWEAQ